MDRLQFAFLVGAALLASVQAQHTQPANPGPCYNADNTPFANIQQCNDIEATADCAAIFPPTGDTRAATCTARQAFALSTCPKTCKLCCLLPEFSCADTVDKTLCDKAVKDNCGENDTTLRNLYRGACPGSCGFCLDNSCHDVRGFECASWSQYCFDERPFGESLRQHCPKTCGTCNPNAQPAATKTVPSSSACVDTRTDCPNLTGFCTAHLKYPNFYTKEFICQKCGTTCAQTCAGMTC
ncbi:hypothetical protein QR680_010287 [Steinernema hermaphroditum]|uniref:ShKT domain-containing protein n=1 Tax=Steinernema hermaphroditum TaxID=289476 RepID=A0AA39ING3_9BILA|nr:hypothetical protein QR680_010287 [Steinernema hermaphroditum]